MPRWLDHAAGEYGIRPAAKHLGETQDLAIEMVRSGFGVTFMPALYPVPPGLVGRPFGRAAATFIKAARARSWAEWKP